MSSFPHLFRAVFTQPAIDNHAHPLLRVQSRNDIPFEGIISEAQGEGLTKDALHTLPCLRATTQLAKLFGLYNASWEDIKAHRASMDYMDLCKLCFKGTNIQCILIDDGLSGADLVEGYSWHDQLTPNASKRIVRAEIVAEGILKEVFGSHVKTGKLPVAGPLFEIFRKNLVEILENDAVNKDVVGFKSIVCYRTGLDIALSNSVEEQEQALLQLFDEFTKTGSLRLKHKPLNDEVVRITLTIAGNHNKPVQFHTGLGDRDIILRLSSPAHMQPIIEYFSQTKFVLLHSSYPYTQEAGYLTAVYENVFLDFGEVFPFVSGEGQRTIIRQVLELTPTNKIMWSSDGHFWPESYYLGIVQARLALYDVLAELVVKGELTEQDGVRIVGLALFHNANHVYGLNL